MKSISFYIGNCFRRCLEYKGHQFVLGKSSKTRVFPCWAYSFDLAARGRSSAADRSSQINTAHPYSLRSLPLDQLVLHSPLRTPHRPRRRINLVSGTAAGASSSSSATMTGPQDPEPTLRELGANMRDLGAKLDRVLGQVSTINNRLDTHDRRIARTEKF